MLTIVLHIILAVLILTTGCVVSRVRTGASHARGAALQPAWAQARQARNPAAHLQRGHGQTRDRR